MSNEWLKELKAGDKVFVVNSWYKNLCIIDKITPTGRIKIYGTYYDKYEGNEIGGSSYNSSCLEQVTKENLKKYEQGLIIEKALKMMKECRKLSFEQAEKIIEILNIE